MFRVFVCLWFLIITGRLNIDAIMQDYYWRYYTPGDIPYDALAFEDGKYIGQVNYLGHDKPATIYSYDQVAVAQWSGKQIIKENIKILCTPDPSRFYWQYVDFDKDINGQMKDAVKGGYQLTLQVYMFIGKIYHDGEWKISKVVSNTNPSKRLWIWDKNNRTVLVQQFFILKYNYTIEMTPSTAVCEK